MIKYKKGYKYQLVEDYQVQTGIFPASKIVSSGGYIALDVDGMLYIKKGYASDGASGPTIDTKNFLRGAFCHDALYQLMRANLLDREVYKDKADRLLRKMCIEDGMGSFRAWYVYQGLRIGGKAATLAKNRKEVLTAP
jgi:hypothetical protein